MPTWIITLWANRKAIAIGLAALALYGAGFETKVKLDQAADGIRARQEQAAQEAAQAKANAAGAAWEKERQALQATNDKLKGRLRNETKAAVYTTCVVPPTGVRIYDAALSGSSAGGVDGAVPGPSPAPVTGPVDDDGRPSVVGD